MTTKAFTQKQALVNAVRLHYSISGKGDPVLLWHGFLGTSYVRREIMPRLVETHTVIAPDMRGYGDSDKPAQGYDARTLVADFRALVRHIGVGPVHLVAHDMGAPPALVWAGEHPDEVRTLTYLDEPVITTECLEQVIQFTPQATQMGGLWWWQFALAPEVAETLLAGHERGSLSGRIVITALLPVQSKQGQSKKSCALSLPLAALAAHSVFTAPYSRHKIRPSHLPETKFAFRFLGWAAKRAWATVPAKC